MTNQDASKTPAPDASQRTRADRLPPGRPVEPPRVPDSPRYSMADLEAETNFTARTIRFYISESILPSPQGRGRSAAYNKEHLLRLRRIEELKSENVPLEEIKDRLRHLTASDLEAHFAIASRPIEGRWRRIVFHPDLELHIREQPETDYAFERAVDQIIQHARFVIEQLGER